MVPVRVFIESGGRFTSGISAARLSQKGNDWGLVAFGYFVHYFVNFSNGS
jgi:hypothetical protein